MNDDAKPTNLFRRELKALCENQLAELTRFVNEEILKSKTPEDADRKMQAFDFRVERLEYFAEEFLRWEHKPKEIS